MYEPEIGIPFDMDGRTLIAIEVNYIGCTGCVFNKQCPDTIICSVLGRKDCKSIIIKGVTK